MTISVSLDVTRTSPGPGLRWLWDRDQDLDVAAAIWRQFTPDAETVFREMLTHPGHHFSADELGHLLRLPNGRYGVAAVFARPAVLCKRYHMTDCWHSDQPADMRFYWMADDDITAAFRQAARIG